MTFLGLILLDRDLLFTCDMPQSFQTLFYSRQIRVQGEGTGGKNRMHLSCKSISMEKVSFLPSDTCVEKKQAGTHEGSGRYVLSVGYKLCMF